MHIVWGILSGVGVAIWSGMAVGMLLDWLNVSLNMETGLSLGCCMWPMWVAFAGTAGGATAQMYHVLSQSEMPVDQCTYQRPGLRAILAVQRWSLRVVAISPILLWAHYLNWGLLETELLPRPAFDYGSIAALLLWILTTVIWRIDMWYWRMRSIAA